MFAEIKETRKAACKWKQPGRRAAVLPSNQPSPALLRCWELEGFALPQPACWVLPWGAQKEGEAAAQQNEGQREH